MSKRKIDARLNNEEKNMKRRKMGLAIKVKNEKREAVAVIAHVKSDPMTKITRAADTVMMNADIPALTTTNIATAPVRREANTAVISRSIILCQLGRVIDFFEATY
uniref:Uncharacterized protein n=1 Tax=Acrobeloides nanus TaxID=290746 RepID=A0A914DDE7_9BILA